MTNRKTPQTTNDTADVPAIDKGGRKNLVLDDKLIRALGKALEDGMPDTTACASLGISTAALYKWIATGRYLKGEIAEPSSLITSEQGQTLCIKLVDRVTRARAKAHQKAINALMFGIKGGTTKRKVVKLFTETRLAKDGITTYEYRREETMNETSILAPDWRAGLAYEERRDRDNWTARQDVMAVDFETEIVKRIKAGVVDFEMLMSEFNDKELVTGWFEKAGVEITVSDDTTG